MCTTKEQHDIITSCKTQSMLVTACPGSGKTFSLVERIRHLMKEHTVKQEKILVITFTNKSTEDIRKKIEIDNVFTVDSFCRKMCVLKGLIDESIPVVYSPDDFKYILYKNLSMVTFSTFYEYVFIDEVQDIDKIQYEIIKRINKDGCVLYMTGDINQNIYGFRDTSNKYIQNFKDYFENISLYKLTENFRTNKKLIVVLNEIEKSMKNFSPDRISRNNSSKTKDIYIEFHGVENTFCYGKVIKRIITEKRLALNKCCIISRNNELLNTAVIHFIRGKMKIETSTIHSSKGCEWDYVFFIGVCDNVLPFGSSNDIEEEKRCYYVGCSRAKMGLFILFDRKKPSFFLSYHKQFRIFNKSKSISVPELHTKTSVKNDEEEESIISKYEERNALRERIKNVFRIETQRINEPFTMDKMYEQNNLEYEFYCTCHLFVIRECVSPTNICLLSDIQKILTKIKSLAYYTQDFFLNQNIQIINESFSNFFNGSKKSKDIVFSLFVVACSLSYLTNKKKLIGFYKIRELEFVFSDIKFCEYLLGIADTLQLSHPELDSNLNIVDKTGKKILTLTYSDRYTDIGKIIDFDYDLIYIINLKEMNLIQIKKNGSKKDSDNVITTINQNVENVFQLIDSNIA